MTPSLPFAFTNSNLDSLSVESIPLDRVSTEDLIISIAKNRVKIIDLSPFHTRDMLSENDKQPLITLGIYHQKRVLIHFHLGEISEQEEHNWHDLRSIALTLSLDLATVIAQASSLSHWHTHHQFCGLCGSKTKIGKEHSRVCLNKHCHHSQFPRIDPAVIMSVVNEQDEMLLGRQASWGENRFSVVAGFLSHGETLEQCVAREVLEETGVIVNSVEYIASQPWPFPSSIMLGFKATATKQAIVTNDDELEEAMWISREELQIKRDLKEIFISPKLSISRYLIDLWIEGK